MQLPSMRYVPFNAPQIPQHRAVSSTPTLATRPQRQSCIVSAAAETQRPPIGNPQPLPGNPSETVDQAFASCKRAWDAGIKRQRVELVLPLIGATDLDDWPGGIRQQFKAAAPMVENLLRQLKALPGLEGPLQARILDDGDAVGAWEGDNLALILFPTAETLREVRSIVESRPERLVIIANPQWEGQGQVVSDFGILPWVRKAALEFIGTFSDAYAVQRQRINGDYVQWTCTYPQGWQVNVVRGPGDSTVIMQAAERPSYQEVEGVLRSLDWTMSSKGLFERIKAEAEFIRRTSQSVPKE